VSKIEIFRVPLIGWNMALNRYIKLKRGDIESVAQMLRECEMHLDEGSSIFMFPEGTRSPDGKVKAFKLGAFQLAREKKVPILPIVISGTNKALPKYSMNFTGVQKIYIKIFEEIPYAAFAHLSAQETAEMVRQFIIEKLKVMNEYTLGGSCRLTQRMCSFGTVATVPYEFDIICDLGRSLILQQSGADFFLPDLQTSFLKNSQ
jgi:1-acyl-sn-glycerol-3-phosphate acyltransferase